MLSCPPGMFVPGGGIVIPPCMFIPGSLAVGGLHIAEPVPIPEKPAPEGETGPEPEGEAGLETEDTGLETELETEEEEDFHNNPQNARTSLLCRKVKREVAKSFRRGLMWD